VVKYSSFPLASGISLAFHTSLPASHFRARLSSPGLLKPPGSLVMTLFLSVDPRERLVLLSRGFPCRFCLLTWLICLVPPFFGFSDSQSFHPQPPLPRRLVFFKGVPVFLLKRNHVLFTFLLALYFSPSRVGFLKYSSAYVSHPVRRLKEGFLQN